MARIEKTTEVNVPVQVVYNQWTQFEEFPNFMEGVKEVRQLDDKHLHWRAETPGKWVGAAAGSSKEASNAATRENSAARTIAGNSGLANHLSGS